MDSELRWLLRRGLGECEFAIAPLTRVARRPPLLVMLLADIGWDLRELLGQPADALTAPLQNVADAVAQLAAAADGADAATATEDVLSAIADSWGALRVQLRAFADDGLLASIPLADDSVREALARVSG